MDALGDPAEGDPAEVEASRDLGRVAVHALLALADITGAVLDSTWCPYTAPLLVPCPHRSSSCGATCPWLWRDSGTVRAC